MRTRRENDTPAPTYGPDLADLVTTERRLEAELAEARVQAEAMVADARAAAATSDGNHSAALRARRAEIDAEVEARAQRRLAALSSLSREHVARLDAIEGSDLDRLARRVAQRLLDALARGGAP